MGRVEELVRRVVHERREFLAVIGDGHRHVDLAQYLEHVVDGRLSQSSSSTVSGVSAGLSVGVRLLSGGRCVELDICGFLARPQLNVIDGDQMVPHIINSVGAEVAAGVRGGRRGCSMTLSLEERVSRTVNRLAVRDRLLSLEGLDDAVHWEPDPTEQTEPGGERTALTAGGR